MASYDDLGRVRVDETFEGDGHAALIAVSRQLLPLFRSLDQLVGGPAYSWTLQLRLTGPPVQSSRALDPDPPENL